MNCFGSELSVVDYSDERLSLDSLGSSMRDICYQCHFGRTKKVTATYVATHNGMPLVVPDVPAYSCDVCGAMEYDADILRELHHLLRQHKAAERNGNAARPVQTPVWLTIA
jgi:YgiT-type zinc finger domain-containing protein